MPWNENQKSDSKEKILHNAATLFTQNGFDAISINDVMKAAGMTRGAFYAHFKSKTDLYQQAIITAAIRARDKVLEKSAPSMSEVATTYLQQEADRDETCLCPLAFLVTDVTHQDSGVRDIYTKVYQSLLQNFKRHPVTSLQAMQASVLMIGGVAIANALVDEDLKSELLDACLKGVKTLEQPDSAKS